MCSVCDGRKNAGQPFCLTDFLALPIHMRNWVSRSLSPDFAEAFRQAHAHLAGHTVRRVLVGHDGATADWPYRTLQEVAEHYELAGEPTRCRVPGCGVQILFVRRDAISKAFPINRTDARPHRLSCKDPDFFRRRREERERAKTKPAPRRRGRR